MRAIQVLGRQTAGASTVTSATIDLTPVRAEWGAMPSLNNIVVYTRIYGVTGTSPTMQLTVNDSPDAAAWYQVGQDTNYTAAANKRFVPVVAAGSTPAPIGRYLQLVFAFGGTTPQFDFEVWVCVE